MMRREKRRLSADGIARCSSPAEELPDRWKPSHSFERVQPMMIIAAMLRTTLSGSREAITFMIGCDHVSPRNV